MTPKSEILPAHPIITPPSPNSISMKQKDVEMQNDATPPPPPPPTTTTTTKVKSLYLNNPIKQAPVHIDSSAPENIRNEQIVKAIQLICPTVFQTTKSSSNSKTTTTTTTTTTTPLTTNHVTIAPLGGGLSNYLYTVISKQNPTNCVLIRIHAGQEDDRFVNRKVENQIMAWLSTNQLSPLYYGRFMNGRIEEFYRGYDPLSCHDLGKQDFGSVIAGHMGKLHTMKAPVGVCQTEQEEEAQIWGRIDGWFDLVRNVQSNEEDSQTVANINPLALDALQVENKMYTEWMWVKTQLQTLELENDNDLGSHMEIKQLALKFSREIVFTHMDAQSLNILCNNNEEREISKELKLIDFEYAGHNCRAADIANTFCEHCDCNNLCPKYESEYPSIDQQQKYLKAYLETVMKESDQYEKEWNLLQENEHDLEIFMEEFRKDVNRFSLISHIGWAIWSVAQAFISPIDFDYLEYARIRMKGYHWAKGKFFLHE